MSAPLSSASVQPMKPSGATPPASPLCTLTLDDLAALFRAPKEEIEKLCGEELSRANLRYRRLDPVRRDVLLMEIMQRIDSLDLPSAGKERQGAWENDWQRNLDEFIRWGHDLEALVPKYFKQGVPVRLLRDYVIPEDPNFVLNFTRLFRTWLFRRYPPIQGPSMNSATVRPATWLGWPENIRRKSSIASTGRDRTKPSFARWPVITAEISRAGILIYSLRPPGSPSIRKARSTPLARSNRSAPGTRTSFNSCCGPGLRSAST